MTLWLPFLALTAGCWQPRYFEPRENVTGLSPEGRPAAVYDLDREQDGAARGQVRVWSDGAFARYTETDEEVVDLFVSLELENNGQQALQLDVESLRVEELYLDGYLQPAVAPLTVNGNDRAEPGTTARLDLTFQPSTTFPRCIDSFALRFAVRGEQGLVSGELTPFVPEPLRPLGDRGYWGDRYWGGPYWGGRPASLLGPWRWGSGWRVPRCR